MFRNQRVVVTGAAGFVGSHVVDALVEAGATVTGLDNLRSGYLSNLSASTGRLDFATADVRDHDRLTSILDGADMVFHLAGNASVPDSVEDPAYDFESNVLSTRSILHMLKDGRVGRVLFASSAAVYGPARQPCIEETHPLEPVSPYGGSKLAAERLGVAYARTYGVQFVVARIFNTYGPRQRKYVMYDLLNKLHVAHDSIDVLGDGQQIRDYSFVSDTVAALLLIAARGCSAEAYNVSGGRPTSIEEVAQLLSASLDRRDIRIIYTGRSWQGDIPVMVASLAKIGELGFSPSVPISDGIARLVDWMKTDVWGA